MRRLTHILTLLMLFALTALPALAQDVEEAEAATFNGLGIMMVLVGLGAAVILGVQMSRREASADDNDLI